MKKRITVVLELDKDEQDPAFTDKFIENDLQSEINCTSNFYDVVSISSVVLDSQTQTNEEINNNYKTKPKTGYWIKKERERKDYRKYTGKDEIGEEHTVTVCEHSNGYELYCSNCGAHASDYFFNFCSKCGAEMKIQEG